ncbi:MAG: hypothetical protein LAT63_02365 [Marinobacter sp.]|nr:hypothetical protein [Marinobacter sp.]
MDRISRLINLTACLLFLSAGAVFAETPRPEVAPEIIERGWRPPVELAGQGDAQLAIARLRDYHSLQKLVMENTEFHQETQKFVDDLWASLERFDLRRFYRMLPEQQDEWRSLRVYGRTGLDSYQLGPEPDDRFRDNSAPQMGDMEAVIRARQIEKRRATHYLLDGQVDLAIGEIRWPSVVQAAHESLRLLTPTGWGKPTEELPVPAHYHQLASTMNPRLRDEELAILAPLWAAFPDVWALMAGLGEIEQLLLEPIADTDYQRVAAIFVIDTQRLRYAYPALSRHLHFMSSLLQMKVELHDEQGKLLTGYIDSEKLRAELHMIVRDGDILPVQGDQPIPAATPFDPNAPRKVTAHIDTRMDILGVIAHVQGMTANIHYQPTAQGARIDTQVTEVPAVSVGGRALGLIPTGMINFFLPRRIDQLMIDFLTIACEGNDGHGITGSLEFRQASAHGESSQVSLQGAFEGLDNFFVRIGMGIVNTRIIPDPAVSEDLRKLFFDAHDAFARDLDQFERLAQTRPR